MLRCCVRQSRRSVLRCLAATKAQHIFPGLGRAVIIAPHPDDEVFGCGGLIAAKRLAGASVHVVFLTAGEASHAGCCDVPKEAVAENRRLLAGTACRQLGLEPSAMHWLGLADGQIPTQAAGKSDALAQDEFDSAAAKLADLLVELAPAEVYCPHPLDGWADHSAASEITRAAVLMAERRTVARAGANRIELWHYLVWAWLNLPLGGIARLGWRKATRLDIGRVIGQKRLAIQTYLQAKAFGCGRPWSGVLPRDFLKAFDWHYEVFFQADLGRPALSQA
jgi:LmbE family N-acetylglucosaminyl deacetylase